VHQHAGGVGAIPVSSGLVEIPHRLEHPGAVHIRGVPNLLNREGATADNDWILLVLGFPAGLRLHLLAFQQKIERLQLRKQRLADATIFLVLFGSGNEVTPGTRSINRPSRSSTCQRVITISSALSLAKRERKSSANQSQVRSLTIGPRLCPSPDRQQRPGGAPSH